mgnify:FL=1
MIQIATTVLGGLFGLLKGSSKSIAGKAGVDESIVSKVLGAVEDYANKDERMQAFLAEQINKARQHDIATFDKADKFSNRLRSSVRPLTTFAAMAWYIYARLNDIPLQAEDYAIIGGIMAFWFGFRPFEKRQ